MRAFRNCLLVTLLGLVAQLCPGLVAQAAAQEPYVPPELSPWVDWVLDTHPELRCPRDSRNGQPAGCVWINRLQIEVGAELGFVMDVQVWVDGAVQLPGNADFRPLDVEADGQPIPVLGDTQPRVMLSPGAYRLSGTIRWANRPSSLAIPAQFGLLSLQMDGETVAQPLVRGGELVLARTEANAGSQDADSLTLDVFRLLEDDYPLRMSTRVVLNVGGRPRLVTVGRALLDGFALTAFESTLPARINAAGDLEVQVTAGQHVVGIGARALAPVESVAMDRTQDAWPEQEIWGFVPDRNLRSARPRADACGRGSAPPETHRAGNRERFAARPRCWGG